MKRILFVMLILLAGASFVSAQIGASPATDVLGAHLNYGRGCTGCHAPHSGAWGNGANKSGDTTAGDYALWGQDVGNLYSKTLNFGDAGRYVETLPGSLTAGTSETSGLLLCLSCHDGNYAQGAMMKNAVYETPLPSTYGTYNTPPTLLGKDGNGAGVYLNDHPVGAEATMGCGGQYNWDCTISGASVLMNGPNSSRFVNNYGFFVSPGTNAAGAPIVVCTTCHNQHLMNVVNVSNNPGTFPVVNGVATPTLPAKGTATGLPTGYYATMFFIRAPYNPADGNTASNQTAQFCRQCHGGEANESNNGQAGTVF
jgi:hypothetical protein